MPTPEPSPEAGQADRPAGALRSYRPVNTFWDIGMDDDTAIWFHQTDGVWHRLVDFYSNSDDSLSPPRVEASLAPSNSREDL